MKDQIYIYSPRRILIEALSCYIHNELGFDCFISNEFLNQKLNNPENETLHLIDAREIGNPEKWKKVRETLSVNGHNSMALFDVPADNPDDFEREAFMLGYRGFFRENIPLEMFMKGIRSIFEGHVWFSRKILDNFHVKTKIHDLISQGENIISLSSREKEILSYIATGFHNGEIADRLCISTHTVRTHVYNLFRKINVPNRLQAALWAANHYTNRNSIEKI